ncbi:conserved hypothetical protein [Rubrivivax sp. A210]|uniref:hypothetical protein n=1 Tax=Rubrivivax sp. A210 TaxID=2772301 RepID=UPI00191B8EB5|nr:hypothetical protein [Rubrivivax sp. A210]CAD5365950.1 conserved hypothetical protein [Rubrivivax sp. A210]
MQTYRHHILGLYDSWNAAEATRDALRRCGLPAVNLRLLKPDRRLMAMAGPQEASDTALLAGGAGAANGVSIEQALAGVSLFVASPVLGALMAQGWQASLGRLVGVLAAGTDDADAADEAPPARGASADTAVLVVQADDERQAVLARQIVATSMGGSNLSTLRDDRAETRTGTPIPQELAGADPVLRSLLNRRHGPERRAATPFD